MAEDVNQHDSQKSEESKTSGGVVNALKTALLAGVCASAIGCATVAPQMHDAGKDLNLIEANVFPNEKTEEQYRKATDASSSVDQITGDPKGGLGDQHKVNWGRSVGGSLFGGFVDPKTPFKVEYKEGVSNPQALRSDSPGQVFWVSANENGAEILTSHVSPSDVEKSTKNVTSTENDNSVFSSDRKTTTINYTAVLTPGEKTFINPRQIPQIQKAINKHNKERQGFIENVEQDGSVPGGFRSTVDAKGTQTQTPNLSRMEQENRDLKLQLEAMREANTTRVEVTDSREQKGRKEVAFTGYRDEKGANKTLVIESDGKEGTPDRVRLDKGKSGAIHCDTDAQQCADDVAKEIKQNPEFLKKLLDNGPSKASGKSTDKDFSTYR